MTRMSEPEALRVTVGLERPYDVLIGPGILKGIGSLVPERRVALVTDSNVAPLHGSQLADRLALDGRDVELIIVEPGEASKSPATWAGIVERLAERGFGRDCVVIGLGGGMVTDLAGFVAATYLRGVAFCSVPTSLLGMVDAGVGGKTGINLRAGKNLAGAFWQPRFVAADVAVLASLPERQFRMGAAEFFKHALISSTGQLDLLDAGRFSARAAPADLAAWLATNIGVKAAIVAADEREAGVRTWLNYGHTLAHALESATNHELEHGEAVAYGILFASLISEARGYEDTVPYARRLLEFVRPAPLPRELELAPLLPFMARDKKNSASANRFVLLERPGSPVVVDNLTSGELESAWTRLIGHAPFREGAPL